MSRFFYSKLAANNLKKNSKTYIPYILTCICTTITFYNMCFLTAAKDLDKLADSSSLRLIMFLGTVVIAVFSVIFLFYTNSFLIKRRKKEFGLFNILGMEKRHIGKIMFFESLIVASVSIVAGVLAGILFSKLMLLLLFKIINFEVVFGFEIPILALAATIALFVLVHIINLIYNLLQVHLSRPVELLKGGNTGEKEPKTKWVMTVIGCICLGTGYYIALATKTPLAALNKFFIAVILVIAGTYCLFTAGSIALLKILRKNKNYYYKLRHFTSISGMIYRMKQNAAGLANICILSTAVIVMLSTTVSLYVGMEDVLRTRFPRNIIVRAFDADDETAEKINSVVEDKLTEYDVDNLNVIRYRGVYLLAGVKGSDIYVEKNIYERNAGFLFITADEYNKVENKNEALAEDEVLLYTLKGDIQSDSINIGSLKMKIAKRLDSLAVSDSANDSLSDCYFMVVNNEETIRRISESLGYSYDNYPGFTYYYGFDAAADKDMQIKLSDELQDKLKELNINGYVDGVEESRESFLTLYGGLFFLGLFLGFLFIMATVLIIYYKQIAEGFDDKQRFEIMQKVGMSRDEVRKSIRSQVLSVFFLPLVAAVIHLAFAFKVITKLLLVFNLTNVPLFILCTAITILVFAILYTVVYMLTARTYYKIVSWQG